MGVGSIVYGFAENTIRESGYMLPVFYLGEFRVTQAAGDSMTLVPTRPLDPPQLQAANNAPRWALYELMPVDSHEAFVAEGSVPDDKEIFGRIDADLVNQLLGGSVPQEVLDAYLRDGTVARSDDPPATHWIRVTFTEEYEHTVDAMEQRSAIDGGFFDGLGQAVDSRLQRADGDTVKFSPGDQLTLKSEAAEELLEKGVATKDQDYFVRPLNSYRYVLSEIQRQIDFLDDQSENLVRQKAVLEAALTLTTEMQTKGQQRQLDLEKDERQLAKELAAIQGYAENLEAELSATKAKMADLYRQNLSSEQELEAIQAAIRRASEERAALAVDG